MLNRYLNYIEHKLIKIKLSNSSEGVLKRLGYSKRAKLLIIHADDLGLSSSENEASIKAMKHGSVNSGSVIVPCLKFQEIVNFSKSNPQADIGIHLTLTSEWFSYKWRPILPTNEVPSLVDSEGYFFDNHINLLSQFNAKDIEKELRAQINLVIESGIVPTHLDTHMFTAFSNPKIQSIYISLGKEYKLPVLLNKDKSILSFNLYKELLVNRVYIAKLDDYTKGLDDFYRNLILSLKPGLNSILVHTAFNNKEMQLITQKEPNYGASWRQADFDFFTGEDCKQIIKNKNIQLITWREIKNKIFP